MNQGQRLKVRLVRLAVDGGGAMRDLGASRTASVTLKNGAARNSLTQLGATAAELSAASRRTPERQEET